MVWLLLRKKGYDNEHSGGSHHRPPSTKGPNGTESDERGLTPRNPKNRNEWNSHCRLDAKNLKELSVRAEG